MSSSTKHLTTDVEYKDDGDTGSVVARFSTFDIIDREGDVVRASAFTDGQEVAMTWAHQWDKPIGKGVVRVAKDHARFEGTFFPTAAGQEARAAVKAMGNLQQYSWGFRVLETQPNDQIRGYDITKAEIFEVSPVLVGANQHTATIAVKGIEAPEPEASEPTPPSIVSEVLSEVGDVAPEEVYRALAARFTELAKSYANEGDRLQEARAAIAREQIALEAASLGWSN